MSIFSTMTGTSRARKKNDFYPTIDRRAIAPLVPFLPAGTVYAEPCAGAGDLIQLLDEIGLICDWACDIDPQRRYIARHNAALITAADMAAASCFITNPPWTRAHLHQLIAVLAPIAPTWLLFDASWSQTKQARALGTRYCTDIVSVGRLKWFAGTKNDPPDDCSWYRFAPDKNGPTAYHWPADRAAASETGNRQGFFDV